MSVKKTYFIAGLPRSGSTLLSSILNQNPRFHSGPNSDVINMMFSVDKFRDGDMYKAHPNPTSLNTIIRSIIMNYYYYHNEPICFDKNRGWTRYIDYIVKYIDPDPKIICPVRDVKSVLTSFIKLLRKNNYRKDNFIDSNIQGDNVTDDDRCKYLLGPGIVGKSIVDLIDGLEKFPSNILLVDYDNLVNNVEKEMKRIYSFLGEEYFEHTKEIKQSYNVNDEEVYKLEGMHDIRSKIEKISDNPKDILSDFMFRECETNTVLKNYEFLRNELKDF